LTRHTAILVALASTAALASMAALTCFIPAAVAETQAAETLVVLHKWAESLGAYDPETGRRRGPSLSVGAVPHEMVLSADRKTLYISNYGVKMYTETTPGANFLSIVDLERGVKVGEIPLGDHRRPHGIEIGRSGRLFVTCDFPPSVVIVDPAARKIVADFAIDQKLPHMLAVAKDERTIYVANSGSGSITVIGVGGGGSSASSSPATRVNVAVGGIPMGVALSADERRLYVTNRDGNAIVVIDTKTSTILRKVEVPGSPARVAVVPDMNRLVTTLIDAGDVALIDTDSFKVLARVHAGERAEGLMIDRRGRYAYVSAQGDNKIVKLALPSLRKVLDIVTDDRPDPAVLVSGRFPWGPAGKAK
jgi:YVTN family beta-propeller protein